MRPFRFALGWILLSATACVSQQQFDFLQWQFDQLQAEHAQLQAQGVPKSDELGALQTQLDECTRARSAALATVTRMRATESELRLQLDQARSSGVERTDSASLEELARVRTAWEAIRKERDRLETQLADKHKEVLLLANQLERLEARLPPPANGAPPSGTP